MALPYSISHPLEQFKSIEYGSEAQRSMNYMLDCFEISAQYISVVLIARIRSHYLATHQALPEQVLAWVQYIDRKRPLSFGDWCSTLLPLSVAAAMTYLPEDIIVSGLSRLVTKKRNLFLGDKKESSIVQIRNEYKGHSTSLSNDLYRQVQESLRPRLTELIDCCRVLEDYDEHELYPLVHTNEKQHVYLFQSLKDDDVSFISANEEALLLITDSLNKVFDDWMRCLVPSFDISRKMNWQEYCERFGEVSDGYLHRIYNQKKYNRELFVDREQLNQSLEGFVRSDKILFPLLGEAGQGKTNQLCHWVELLRTQGENVLIFSGTDFTEETLQQKLHTLLNIPFRKSLDKELERLEQLAAEQNKPIYIFFDAINECVDYFNIEDKQQAVIALFEDICTLFAHRTLSHFRVLFTCRNYTWQTSLVPQMSTMDTSLFYAYGNEEAVSVRGFTNTEVQRAYAIYSELYQIHTPFTDLPRAIVLRLKDPLMLKITCTNYLGHTLPYENLDYTSIHLFSRMMKDIHNSYAGGNQHRILEQIGHLIVEKFLRGESSDSIFIMQLAGHAETEELLSMLYRHDGMTIAFTELLDKPERPILRLVDNEKIQFVYERLLEYMLARELYQRFAVDNALTAQTVVNTLRCNTYSEVFISAIRDLVIMHLINSDSPVLLIELIRSFGADPAVMSLINDVMSTLVKEHYEHLLFLIEDTLMVQDADAYASQLSEYNTICLRISNNQADEQVIRRHKELSSVVQPIIRMRQLAAQTLVNRMYVTDYYNENLYHRDPFTLLGQLMDESIVEVRDAVCLYVYYLSSRTHTIGYEPLVENLTQRIIRQMLHQVTSCPLWRLPLLGKRRLMRMISYFETGLRLDVLLIIDALLRQDDTSYQQVSDLMGDITAVFKHITANYHLIRLVMPLMNSLFLKQLTFQSAYVNNIIEYQTFWDKEVVSAEPRADVWSRADLTALAQYMRTYSTFVAPNAPRRGEHYPSFDAMHDKVLQAYRIGDALSYFAIERILVIMSVAEMESVERLMKRFRDGFLASTEWEDYSRMSLIYVLYQIGLKNANPPMWVLDMLGEWSMEWTLRTRGYFAARNSYKANPMQLYKRNVMVWYAKVYCSIYGDRRDAQQQTVPVFRTLIHQAVANNDKELLVHLINNIVELITDSPYIHTALDLLYLVMSLLPDEASLVRLNKSASLRYPDTREQVSELIAKALGTAKVYFPAEINTFLKKDTLTLTFPGIQSCRNELLGFNPSGEKLSDLITHKFGNFIIWTLIYESAVDEAVIEALSSAENYDDYIACFKQVLRIVFKYTFNVKL